MNRPHVLIKTAMSLDGFIADSSGERVIFSHSDDARLVEDLRSAQDAILVGAQTLRHDNPRLVAKTEQHREARLSRGALPDPIKVTLTRTGNLDPGLRFFLTGQSKRFVYCTNRFSDALTKKLGGLADVVAVDDDVVDPRFVLEHLYLQGVRSLMIEGGGTVNGLFLQSGMVDQMRIAIAPIVLGTRGTARIVEGLDTWGDQMRLDRVEQLGDMMIAWYQRRA